MPSSVAAYIEGLNAADKTEANARLRCMTATLKEYNGQDFNWRDDSVLALRLVSGDLPDEEFSYRDIAQEMKEIQRLYSSTPYHSLMEKTFKGMAYEIKLNKPELRWETIYELLKFYVPSLSRCHIYS